MNNNEALQILKLAIEAQSTDCPSSLSRLVVTLKNFISEKEILNELERNNLGETLLLIDKYLFRSTHFQPYYFESDLERFPFQEKLNVSIDDIKALLRIDTLTLRAVNDLSGNTTSCCQHWDGRRRIAVRIDRELLNRLLTNRAIPLFLTKETIQAKLGYYHKFTIKEYDNTPLEMDEYYYKRHNSRYDEYNGYNDYDDDAIDNAFNGDPSNTWNVD